MRYQLGVDFEGVTTIEAVERHVSNVPQVYDPNLASVLDALALRLPTWVPVTVESLVDRKHQGPVVLPMLATDPEVHPLSRYRGPEGWLIVEIYLAFV